MQPINPFSAPKFKQPQQRIQIVNFLLDSSKNYLEILCFPRFVEGFGSHSESASPGRAALSVKTCPVNIWRR